eukprot:1496403-Amphidinium_carterae.1
MTAQRWECSAVARGVYLAQAMQGSEGGKPLGRFERSSVPKSGGLMEAGASQAFNTRARVHCQEPHGKPEEVPLA